MQHLRLDTAAEQQSVLDRLPGAQRLLPDELPFAGCSALVAVDEVKPSPPTCTMPSRLLASPRERSNG
jgi:hypothetical protein